MYGFLPGFMYLGGLDDRLFVSRKSIPSRRILKGSVAIGGLKLVFILRFAGWVVCNR